MGKNYFCLLAILAGFCSGILAADGENTTSWYWEQGVAHARTDHPDSAFFYLYSTFDRGIAEDSLYYLWAEIYLNKGAADTALVLNLKIKPDSASKLTRLIYEQRYLIYSSLGWEKEAKAVFDSTGFSSEVRPLTWLIPECVLYISAGGFAEKSYVDKEYPFTRAYDSFDTSVNGSMSGSLRFGWLLPARRRQRLQIGTRLRYAGSRFSLMAESVHSIDSADASLGAYIKYSLFSEALSFSYTISGKRDYLKAETAVHSGYIRYLLLGKDWIGSADLGYQYEETPKEHYYYLLGWYDRMVSRKVDISGELYLSGVSAPVIDVGQLYLLFDEKDGEAYIHGTDEKISGMQKIFSPDYVSQVITQSYWSAAPSVRMEYNVTKKVSAGVGVRYSCTWYREPYEWYDFGGVTDEQVPVLDVGSVLVFSRNDNMYRWATLLNPVRADVLVDSTMPAWHFRKKRIDQSFSLNVFLKRSFGKIGDGMLNATVRRNFSTLTEATPVDIQKWYGALMFSWFFSYRPEHAR